MRAAFAFGGGPAAGEVVSAQAAAEERGDRSRSMVYGIHGLGSTGGGTTPLDRPVPCSPAGSEEDLSGSNGVSDAFLEA